VTFLTEKDGKLYASSDEKWRGCLEIRGLGIVRGMPVKQDIIINYLIELTDEKTARMPDKISSKTYCGVDIPTFKINKDEKYLPTLVKIAGKIISKEVCLLSLESK
jgi:serine kinase of HPr protein (carbohydrate metabolism regulator)